MEDHVVECGLWGNVDDLTLRYFVSNEGTVVIHRIAISVSLSLSEPMPTGVVFDLRPYRSHRVHLASYITLLLHAPHCPRRPISSPSPSKQHISSPTTFRASRRLSGSATRGELLTTNCDRRPAGDHTHYLARWIDCT